MGAPLLAAGAAGGPVGEGAGLAATLVKVVLSFLKGDGPQKIQAAHREQIFEVAGDYIRWWAIQGYMSAGEMTTALNQLITLGTQNLQALNTTQAGWGIRNMTNVIEALIAAPGSAPATFTLSWNRAAAIAAGQAHTPPANGWYPDAYQQGVLLAVQVMEQGIMPSRPVTSQIGATLSSLTSGGSSKTLLLGAGALLLAKTFF